MLVEITVELDAEGQNVADRLAHKLFEVIVDEPYVLSVAMSTPVEGDFGRRVDE